MNATSRKKYETELRRLDDQAAELERQWQHTPRFALFALLAPVVGFEFGFAAAMVELMVSAALVGTYSYLIGVRRSENRWTRASVARELEGAEQAARTAEDHGPGAGFPLGKERQEGPLDDGLRYDSLVSAHSRKAAIDIAAEALPAGNSIVHVEARDVAQREGPDSWQVAIWFSGKLSRVEA